jgi:hypothetical protein
LGRHQRLKISRAARRADSRHRERLFRKTVLLPTATMSAIERLPTELWDHIIDQLYNQPDALKSCSKVSKSWAIRSRKHIFSSISFNSVAFVVAWRNAFPDPCNSPAHHAKTLTIRMNQNNMFPPKYIPSFCNVTRLVLHVHPNHNCQVSLLPLYGFAPSLKSVRMTFQTLAAGSIMSLMYTFPLLDDLLLVGNPSESRTKATLPATPPTLSGSVCLMVYPGMRIMVDNLLSLPSGIHFRELTLPWICDEDVCPMLDLISACSGTLESLQVLSRMDRTYPSRSLPFV